MYFIEVIWYNNSLHTEVYFKNMGPLLTSFTLFNCHYQDLNVFVKKSSLQSREEPVEGYAKR